MAGNLGDIGTPGKRGSTFVPLLVAAPMAPKPRSVRENIQVVEAREIEPCAFWQETEAGLGRCQATFPLEHRPQSRLDLMQVQHI